MVESQFTLHGAKRVTNMGQAGVSTADYQSVLGGRGTVADHHGSGAGSDKPLLVGIVVVLVAFTMATLAGWTTSPKARALAVASMEEVPAHAAPAHPDPGHVEHGDGHSGHALPHVFAVAPFLMLLGAIALFPLVKFTEHWWESNANRFLVAVVLAGVTLLYYLTIYQEASLMAVWHRIDHAILGEYIPFIVLLFSLYVISGGIRISGDLKARPMTNAGFMLTGGLLASFIGTTGAAMLLIRPLLETNAERRFRQHTVVFFIFIVCNCGGCLLPIGDPPLFLGYLQGVDFLWTMTALWKPWLLANTLLIILYLVVDKFYFYRKETLKDLRQDETHTTRLQVRGLMPNALLLLGVILAVALLDPNKPFPGTNWYPYVYLRETIQLTLVGLSLWLGSQAIRRENRFNYHAIVEVAALFVGIFICMQPALEILNERGPDLGIDSPTKFYWITGALSSVLDNAPTYLVFFKTADAQMGAQSLIDMLGDPSSAAYLNLVAISLGSVFMGAMTYIGNGPNFMVRAIAEEAGVKMPSFFGYVIFFSIPILLPILAIVAFVFL